MPDFRKWKSINKFSDAYILANKMGVNNFVYRGKIKLHGSNAGIHFHDGKLFPQKRSDFISVDDDNAGFAKFVSQLNFKKPETDLIIYGEWAGPGVQKGDAVTNIPNKSFFVFSVYSESMGHMFYDPSDLEDIISVIFGEDYETQNIYVLPWATEEYEIQFAKQDTCQQFIDSVMKIVDTDIAEVDPYIRDKFGVEGPGEGFVMYGIRGQMIDGTPVEENYLLDYIFKAKTESHTVQKEKKRNHVAPEKPEGIEDFIDMFFTVNRFEQMLDQIGGEADKKKTGEFMKAVMTDVYKESEQEILVADFEWKDVPKYAAPIVKQWWFARCDQLS